MNARTLAPTLAVLAACLALAPPAAAQQDLPFTFEGRLTTAAGEPVVGHRVVFRAEDDPLAVWIGPPTDADGWYRIQLPSGFTYVAAAVITPRGRRVDLGSLPGISGEPGAVRNLQLEIGVPEADFEDPLPFAGADRLFLQFVEDAPRLDGFRIDGLAGGLAFEDADVLLTELSAAASFATLPNVELGARVGFAGADLDAGGDASGPTDLEAWARLWLGPRLARGARFSAGALATLPTGDAETGLSAEALRTKLFAAARWDAGPRVTVTGHLGVRFNEDADLGGAVLDGQVAPALGLGALVPLHERVVAVGELTWEGARFDGGDPDASALLGVNWAPLTRGMFRAAVSFGLTDAAPDSRLLAGYALTF